MRLLAQVRRAGRVRRERTDWATLLVAIFVLAGFPVQVIIGVTTQAAPDGTPVIPQGLWLAAGVLLAAVIFAVTTAIGPVRVSLPEYSWVLGGPIDRRSELAPRWAGLLLVTGLVGAVAGVVGPAFGDAAAEVLVAGGILGCALGLGIAAAATGLQGRAARTRRRVQRAVMTAVGVGLAAATVLAAARVSFAVPAAVVLIGATVAVVFAVVCHGVGVARRRRPGSGGADRRERAVQRDQRGGAVPGTRPARRRAGRTAAVDPADRPTPVLPHRPGPGPAGGGGGPNPAEPAGVRRAAGRGAGGVRGGAGRARQVAARRCAAVRGAGGVAVRDGVPADQPVGVAAPDARRHRRHAAGRAPGDAGGRFACCSSSRSHPRCRRRAGRRSRSIPVGVIVNLWTRTKGKPTVTADRVGDIGFGPIPIDLTWYYVREIAPLAITLALQLAI